ncbi:MAG: GNAT family N-acetyltransferase [Candidatus Hodarchaeota archaeon]
MPKKHSSVPQTSQISEFCLLAELNPIEKKEISNFCLNFIQSKSKEQLMNATYILGDLEHFANDFEIAISRSDKSINAILIRRKPIYVPLGYKKDSFHLILEQMNQNNYFVRIPPSWQSDFVKEFDFSDEMHNIAFWLKDYESFASRDPPKELKVRLASTKADFEALAKYYSSSLDSLLATAKTHPRVLGMLGEQVVSVARTNSISKRFAILGGMHTRMEHRDRGYGTAVASTWTQEILRRKLTPTLETDADNHPALRIYRGLGYVEIGRHFYYEKGSKIIARLRSRG